MVRRLKSRGGAAAVEFAVVLPVLVMLLFGILEFGIILYDKAVITNASREGARAGIVFLDCDDLEEPDIRNVVEEYCSSYLITFGGSSSPYIDISWQGTIPNRELKVDVRYPYTFLVLPRLAASLAGPINMQSVTVMRMEKQTIDPPSCPHSSS